ncbi:hypothetical protein BLA60_37930 [Actinophytocola xinjiangensis]|uniref:Mce-associated membrane protein n=1 Tax=Actinophytocola xinjiangensis TaxID=485602 RepID=A0A7Z1AUX1_9PSEU|nr:hypothetical protein [Actinophytocola xinjiangensis]OLF05017.1 hypothetical protein BLA60_37930 [Actinophytocola xinjiangensis]
MSTSTTEPDADTDTEPDADTDADTDTDVADPAPPRRSRLVVALLVVAAVLVGAGVWFLTESSQLRDTTTSNSALVDTARTAEVSAAVTTALNRILSYSYDRTEDTEAAADAVLRGEARQAYDKLFEEVVAKAPEQKLVLTSRVVTSAVQELSENEATVLVFVDQSATRADAGTSNASAAQLSIKVRRDGDTWVITGLEPR